VETWAYKEAWTGAWRKFTYYRIDFGFYSQSLHVEQ
jgi:hypothetical protein